MRVFVDSCVRYVQGYNGHLFWDQDTWMFPPVLLLHQDLAKILMTARLRTLDGAYENARRHGNKGAQYPWESAVTGTKLKVTECF